MTVTTNSDQSTTFEPLKMEGKIKLVFLLCLAWFSLGTLVDTWAHFHIINELESFFTPWHAILYTGGMATSAILIYIIARNYFAGFSLSDAIPRGYEYAFLGVGIFLLSGITDGIWHTLFGIEFGIEAAYSPTHNLGFIAGLFIWGSPIREALVAKDSRQLSSWKELGPPLFSGFVLFALFGTIVAPFSPYLMIWMTEFPENSYQFYNQDQLLGTDYLFQAVGIAGFMIFPAMITMITAIYGERFNLKPGFLFLFYFLVLGEQSLMNHNFYLLVPSLISAITVEILYLVIKPSSDKSLSWEVFTMINIFSMTMFYMLSIYFIEGIWWSIHMIIGAPFIATFFSVLLVIGLNQFKG